MGLSVPLHLRSVHPLLYVRSQRQFVVLMQPVLFLQRHVHYHQMTKPPLVSHVPMALGHLTSVQPLLHVHHPFHSHVLISHVVKPSVSVPSSRHVPRKLHSVVHLVCVQPVHGIVNHLLTLLSVRLTHQSSALSMKDKPLVFQILITALVSNRMMMIVEFHLPTQSGQALTLTSLVALLGSCSAVMAFVVKTHHYVLR